MRRANLVINANKVPALAMLQHFFKVTISLLLMSLSYIVSAPQFATFALFAQTAFITQRYLIVIDVVTIFEDRHWYVLS